VLIIIAGVIAAAPLLAWCAQPVLIAFELGRLYERIQARRR
jgi:hypothetical protein